jgi:probable rRNA maturation factor
MKSKIFYPKPPRPVIEIANRYSAHKLKLHVIERFLSFCLHILGLPHAHLSVVLTQNQEMKALNHKFRGQNQSTDVLSFGMHEKRQNHDPLPPNHQILGDIVVSVPYIWQHAQDVGRDPQLELAWCFIHGILHLLGYDHHTLLERKRMQVSEFGLLHMTTHQGSSRGLLRFS